MKIIETTLKQKMEALRGNQYFDDLAESMLKDIAQHTRLSEFQRGDVLFWEGDPCEGLFILQQSSINGQKIRLFLRDACSAPSIFSHTDS